ncbi:MAG: M48 family metallopeptidase [Bacteroidales bacterium]|nr:M48 family metallopeptidase [Bacteroidales bacterium]
MTTKLNRYIITYGDLAINVKEHRLSRRPKVRIHRDNSITVSCPPRTSKFAVGQFIMEVMPWIEKTLAKNQNRRAPVKPYLPTFKSRKHELEYQVHEKNFIKVEFSEQKILVKYPNSLDICSKQVQDVAYKAMVQALKKEAYEYVPERLKQLAQQNGLKYKDLSITATRSRWGSCAITGRISISCFVMVLPDDLIDLILLHELAHRVHMNHSAAFHATLNQMLPLHNEKELNKRLKEFKIEKP